MKEVYWVVLGAGIFLVLCAARMKDRRMLDVGFLTVVLAVCCGNI